MKLNSINGRPAMKTSARPIQAEGRSPSQGPVFTGGFGSTKAAGGTSHYVLARPLRYGIAVGSVAVAFGLTRVFLYFSLPQPFTALALCAISMTFWFAGTRPGILAVLLSLLTRSFLFGAETSGLSRAVYDLVFLLFAALMIWVRRSRNALEVEVEERTAKLSTANEDLRKQKEQLDGLFELSPDAVVLTDGDFHVLRVNKEFTRIFGYTAEEAVGKWVADLIVPEGFHAEALKNRDQLVSGKRVELEAVRQRKDGVRFDVSVVATAISLGSGHIAVYLIYRDITEHKKAEQALQRSEERWRSVFENSAIGVSLTDPDGGRFLATNHVYQRMLGYTDEELRALSFLDVTPEEYREVNWALDTELLEGKRQQFQMEKKYRRKDGSLIWVNVNVSLVPGTDRVPQFFMALSEDITERKRAQEALQRSESYLVEGQRLAKTGSWAVNPKTETCVYWSEEMRQIFGFDPQRSNLPGREEFLRFVHPEDRAGFNERVDHALRAKADIVQDYRIVLPNGTIKHIHGIGHPVFDETGNIVEYVGTDVDVTERKRAEEALRRSEGYLAEAQRVSHTGSFGWRVSSGAIYWSEETFRIFELDPASQPTLRLILERTHPEDRERLQETISIAAQQRSDVDFEHRLVMADGRIKQVRVVGHPSNKNEADVEFVGAVMDITDTKNTEASLRQSENYLATAQHLAHIGSWAWEVPSQKILYLSDEWHRIYGFDPTKSAVTWEERLQRIHPEDVATWRAKVDRAIQEKTGYEGEFRLVLPDGKVRHIHTVALPVLNASREVVQFVGSTADITERKLAEEFLRRSEAYLAEGQRLTKMGSWSANVTTRQHLHWSEEHTRLYGFDPQGKEPTFEEIFQRIHPDDRKPVFAKFEDANRDGKDIQVDYRVLLPDGTLKYMQTVGHPVLKPSGEVGEFFGITRDVTQQRLYDQELDRLRQIEADLAHISRVTTMGELTASLAHEVNQPIAAAMTDASTCLTWLTRDHPDVKEAREAAARVVRATTVAADIVSRIRSLFKKNIPEPSVIDVNDIIREMTILLRNEMIRHLISARTELSGKPVCVMGDRVQLQQVFMNLMLNSIDAMKTVSGKRELVIKAEEDDNQQVLVSVSDSGIGLPPGQLDQLFDAFFTTKPEGTGMGLRISRSIIETHGGRLWAGTNSPHGAVFNFTLPLAIDTQG